MLGKKERRITVRDTCVNKHGFITSAQLKSAQDWKRKIIVMQLDKYSLPHMHTANNATMIKPLTD